MTTSLTSKFIRAHNVNVSVSNSGSLVWMMKLIYEFWGFCLHGENNLTGAMGFATSGINMPSGFQSGSLLATGSTGYTVAGESLFYDSNADFTSGSFVDKHLVTWKSGSTSNDDSIYKIIKIVSSQSIQVDTNNGATPYSGSLIPLFTDRSSINYRIIDFESTVNNVAYSSGSYMILNLSGASLINSGQTTPQVKIAFNDAAGFDDVAISWSPSGSWTGSSFTDEVTATSADWCNGSAGTGHISLWGASDYLICHYRGDWCTNACLFHVEVPERIYTQNIDPNPVVVMMYNISSFGIGSTTISYGGGWYVHYPPTNEKLQLVTLAKSPHGDYFPQTVYPTSYNLQSTTNGRYNNSFYNPVQNQFIVSDVLFSHEALNKYAIGRLRARRWRVMAANLVPRYTRLGTNGEYIYVGGSVLLPWDNAILPYDLLRSGD